MEIETFPFSRYFCIVEHGTHNDHRLKLSYYDFTVFEKFKKEGKIVPSPINHPQINVGELPCLAEYLSSGN